MKPSQSPYAFILGCERCGSTWLSNVLDAHPDVEFFMEPFADYAGLFPGFADRNLYIDHQSDNMATVLSEGFNELSRRKYGLFYGRGKSLLWKKLDRFVVALHTNVGNLQRFSPALSVKQFELLNLNLRKVPASFQTRKHKKAVLTVTKELRLNFKVGLLQRVFPGSKYIIVVRHPGAQVTSILRMLRAGHLGELRRSLLSLSSYLRASQRFDKYSDHFDCLDREQVTSEMLLLWWLINYQTAIEDCKRHNVDFRTVFHEDLSASPEKEYQAILSFLELDNHEGVRAYVRHSTMGSDSKSASLKRSPLDTVRNSASFSKASIANVGGEVRSRIASLLERFDVCDELIRYRSLTE